MDKDEILIVQAPYPIKNKVAKEMLDQLKAQKESGVIILPFGWTAIVKPKDLIIGVATEENTNGRK